MLKNPQRLSVLGLYIILLSTTAAAEERKPVVTSDVLKIKTMGQIDISPDGKRVVFAVISIGKARKPITATGVMRLGGLLRIFMPVKILLKFFNLLELLRKKHVT